MPIDGAGALPAARVCAELGPLLLDERRARIDAAAASGSAGCGWCIENLHDPHNGAAVLRSAEAFGVQRVEVIESVEPFRYSTTVTQGCEKWLDIVRHTTLAAARGGAARATGSSSTPRCRARRVALDDLDFSRPAAIMVGNEHDGLTAEAMASADVRFGIPMAGMTPSLNLSVAAALIVERATTLRRRALGAAAISRTTPILRAAGAVLRRVGARRRGRAGAGRAGERGVS